MNYYLKRLKQFCFLAKRSLGIIFILLILIVLCPKLINKGFALIEVERRFPNILFITVDTLSARFLGFQGAANSCTPNIDRLASEGAVFRNFYSNSSWTRPSFASLFTSKNPQNHKVRFDASNLENSHLTLAEELSALGYKTFGVISQMNLLAEFGYAQGFSQYQDVSTDPTSRSSSKEVSDSIINIMIDYNKNAKKENSPFFIFAHYFDPHMFYLDHKEFSLTTSYTGKLRAPIRPSVLSRPWDKTLSQDDLKYLTDLHRSEIAFTDIQIQRILDKLQELELSSDTIIIFTSDHGEEFLEHGNFGHRINLYEETVRVPLIIKYPGTIKHQLYNHPASLVDVMPTLLELINSNIKRDFWEGHSLTKTLKTGKESTNTDPVILELKYDTGSYLSAIIDGNYKLIVNHTSQNIELYDLASDPRETRNIAKKLPHVAQKLKQHIIDYEKRTEKLEELSPSIENEQQKLRQLRSLGYIN